MKPTPLKAMAPEEIERIVRGIDPGFERKGNELVLLNPNRKDKNRKSFKINRMTGIWADFATGKRGKGIAHFLAYCRVPTKPNPSATATEAPKPSTAWDAAPKDDPGPNFRLSKHGVPGYRFTASWCYRNAQSRPVMYVARFDQPGKEKEIRPFRWDARIKKWVMGDPKGTLPLYHLDQMEARPDAQVLICEGEKAADAAQLRFQGMVVATSPHGANSASKADWNAMAGRSITIWPDYDDPGQQYALEVTKLAYSAGAVKVQIVHVPDDFPPKWDLADKPPKGVSLLKLLKAAVKVERPKILADYVMSLREFQAMPIKPRDYLIFPWLSASSLNMVFAVRGLGKSWFVHYLALCLSGGLKFFEWNVPRRCRVLLVDGEMPNAVLQKRFRILAGKDISDGLDILSSEALWLMGQPLNFNDAETQDRFQQMLDARFAVGLKPDLIIIDNLSSTTAGSDENDNGALDGLLRWLMGLRHQGYAVLLVHHSGKNGEQRGASRREDLLDTSIRLSAPANLPELSRGACFEISFPKTRDERPRPDRLTVEMGIGDTGQAAWKTIQPVSDKIMILQEIRDHAPKSNRELASLLGISPTTVGKRISPMIQGGLLMRAGKQIVLTAAGLAQIAPPSPRKYQIKPPRKVSNPL